MVIETAVKMMKMMLIAVNHLVAVKILVTVSKASQREMVTGMVTVGECLVWELLSFRM